MNLQIQKGKEIRRKPGDADFMREFFYLGDILPSAQSCLPFSFPFCHSLTSPSSFFDKMERILIWIHLYNCDKLRQS